ncbi:N-terminal nucleophile aminohydrolase [Terfezia boudieri ATCC MYA-4762]|uniref:Proteasome subunit beta n=1 Tax=Terfezia boudieri ATCC MYA-4762 TaxID=1051890 RepID=A0A3N4LX20_9PEZI|nr:N-terminal nucleophile aminohydrolase [Terfezia boudieri ATCC MYA-4762]
MKAEDDKTRILNDHCLMAYSGEAGDTGMLTRSFGRGKVQFAEFIQANVQLYGMRSNCTQALSPSSVSSFVRTELAKSLRSRKPYNLNLLIGGYDTVNDKPELYWLDFLAAKDKLPYAAHGYAQYYCLSILDKHHHPNIDLEQGLKILRMCIEELDRRMPMNFKGVNVKVITKTGIQDLEY